MSALMCGMTKGRAMDRNRQRLTNEMAARREQLRLNWTKVAQLAGMTPQNLLRIRNGEIAVTDDAANGIERALQWSEGSVQQILEGHDAKERDPEPMRVQPSRGTLTRAQIARMSKGQISDIAEMIRETVGKEAAIDWVVGASRIQDEELQGGRRTG